MIPLSNSLGLSLFRKLTVGTFLSSHLAKRQSLSLSLELKIGKKRGGLTDKTEEATPLPNAHLLFAGFMCASVVWIVLFNFGPSGNSSVHYGSRLFHYVLARILAS